MSSIEKPFSQACENNKRPILGVLSRVFQNATHILEIGSGTGQHAVFLADNLPHANWYTSDQEHYHAGINAWLSDNPISNLHSPICFKIGENPFPSLPIDNIFTANTAHIMQKSEVKLLMQLVSAHLPSHGYFCQYGPFTVRGKFNSQSNYDFHLSLIERGFGGYRDIEELTAWAPALELKEVIDMPANNMMLVWMKRSAG